MIKNYTLNQLPEIAKEVIDHSTHKVLLFYGEMGVGKTTLIKEIVKQLGADEIIQPEQQSGKRLASKIISNNRNFESPLLQIGANFVFHFDNDLIIVGINTDASSFCALVSSNNVQRPICSKPKAR